MGAGMTGMAGMALSSYLNERQRRKAAKHSGKAGTYILLDFFKFRELSHEALLLDRHSTLSRSSGPWLSTRIEISKKKSNMFLGKIQFDFTIQFL